MSGKELVFGVGTFEAGTGGLILAYGLSQPMLGSA
jgi:hypothetical protein